MSHIDSYDHEYIGRFMYLPVYHPLQEVERYKWGEEDFGFTPANLVIGGGSGGLACAKRAAAHECTAARRRAALRNPLPMLRTPTRCHW